MAYPQSGHHSSLVQDRESLPAETSVLPTMLRSQMDKKSTSSFAAAVVLNFNWHRIYIWLVFSCLHGQAPQYLSDFCQPVSGVVSRQHLRSASRRQLVVPRYRLSTYGRRAFALAGPSVWNSLPDNLRDPAVGSDSFRRSLKTFVCDVLRHAAHSGFYENALYKFTFTYLLTYLVCMKWLMSVKFHSY